LARRSDLYVAPTSPSICAGPIKKIVLSGKTYKLTSTYARKTALALVEIPHAPQRRPCTPRSRKLHRVLHVSPSAAPSARAVRQVRHATPCAVSPPHASCATNNKRDGHVLWRCCLWTWLMPSVYLGAPAALLRQPTGQQIHFHGKFVIMLVHSVCM
jgi:hypothetical protein